MQTTLNNNKIIMDLQQRQKHILSLQSELLRVDYEYGVIVKNLKQKYSHIAQQFQAISIKTQQLKKQNKKLYSIIHRTQQQAQHYKKQLQDINMKNGYNQQSIKKYKSQNQMLRNQIKHFQVNQKKNFMKIQQMHKKKQQYKMENSRLLVKVQELERGIKKIQGKKRQLQMLVQQQVADTQLRIHNIGQQLFNTTPYDNIKNQQNISNNKSIQQIQSNKTFKIGQYKINSQENNKTLYCHDNKINDWQSDMKKLKNCVDYGPSYILVFDSANLDRIVSKQIFKYIKKCLSQIQSLQFQVSQLKQSNSTHIHEHRHALSVLQQQLNRLVKQTRNNSKPIMIDTQIQTDDESKNNIQTQRALHKLSQLNTRTKMKNIGLIQCVKLLALRAVVIQQFNENIRYKQKYYRQMYKVFHKQEHYINNTNKLKPINRLRSICISIIFIKKISKSTQNNKLYQPSQKTQNSQQFISDTKYQLNNKSQRYNKLQSQIQKLQIQQINNPQLQKLKDVNTFVTGCHNNRQSLYLYQRIDQIIQYYKFKFYKKDNNTNYHDIYTGNGILFNGGRNKIYV